MKAKNLVSRDDNGMSSRRNMTARNLVSRDSGSQNGGRRAHAYDMMSGDSSGGRARQKFGFENKMKSTNTKLGRISFTDYRPSVQKLSTRKP